MNTPLPTSHTHHRTLDEQLSREQAREIAKRREHLGEARWVTLRLEQVRTAGERRVA